MIKEFKMNRQVGVNEASEIVFPDGYQFSGYPVDPAKAPSYEEALAILKRVDYLLNVKTGPGAQKRLAQAKDIVKKAVDFDVWTTNMLNKEGGYIKINYRDYGTFMDPASETYHTM